MCIQFFSSVAVSYISPTIVCFGAYEPYVWNAFSTKCIRSADENEEEKYSGVRTEKKTHTKMKKTVTSITKNGTFKKNEIKLKQWCVCVCWQVDTWHTGANAFILSPVFIFWIVSMH